MPRITVIPMMGRVRNERMYSLQGCHALFESANVARCEPKDLGTTLEATMKKALLSDYVREQLLRYPEDGVYVIVKFEP